MDNHNNTNSNTDTNMNTNSTTNNIIDMHTNINDNDNTSINISTIIHIKINPNTSTNTNTGTSFHININITINIVTKSNDLNVLKITNIPNDKPTSPIRLIIIAFIADLLASNRVYQKLINKYEHNPTPSHPINNCNRLSLVTNTNIKKLKRDK